jgi:tRNA-specific 2-thiouridylase
MKPPIAIAVSGGIDSLVAAYLLKKEGHDVIGIHFVTGYEVEDPLDPTSKGKGSSLQALQKTNHISALLGIDIKLIDCKVEFKQTVIDYFIRTYQNGQTPNPCMVCNPSIKFGIILNAARMLGASCLATGHYARISRDDTGRFHLFRGVDSEKEQSYFLARMTQKQLAQTRFPLGEMKKTDVIKLADQKGLAPITKKESQDICFVKGNTYGNFLASQREFEAQPGLIQDVNGNIIGQHDGLHLYTIGQRRGINCPSVAPYYVVGMDRKQNLLKVGSKKDLLASEFKVVEINWIHRKPDFPVNVQTRVRYRHRAAASTLIPVDAHTAVVRFEVPQSAITPGQCAVFYQDDEVLGGGWIAPDT